MFCTEELKFVNDILLLHPTQGASKSAKIIGKSKSNLNTALLQLLLLFVADTAPGIGFIGKSEWLLPLYTHPAQTDW